MMRSKAHLADRDRAAEKRLSLSDAVNMRMTLAQSGSGTNRALSTLTRRSNTRLRNLAIQKGQRDAAVANIDVLTRQRDRACANFIAENGQKLAEAQKQAGDSLEKLVKAKLNSARMSLISPIAGVVYGLSVTTIGQVLASDDELTHSS
jgi:hemolysin D